MRARAGAAAVLAAVLVGSGTAASASGPASPPAVPTSATSGDTTSTVTLITGDRVTLTQSADGPRNVAVERGPGREGVGFLQQKQNGRLFVIPTDVADLVPDRLDRALFDVTGLAASGYGETHPDTVPVIVQATAAGEATTRGARAASAEPDWATFGIEPERRLESVGAVAADLDADSAADLLAALQAPAPDARTATAAPDLKVWLDAPVQALDADSAPQIGAPEAWDAGYTGAGVTVAVLDTGVDTTHPDLDDVAVGSRDFTGKGSTTDGFGHGTHVASIALGTGDASEGVNSGMAPDADLLIGKVLDDEGYGETSWVIEGMEWAAGEGADVVNLSLGDSANYSDGTDPASLAVDALSAEHDTLFVVSAGNDGDYGTISTPGAADSALTVGAVDDADDITWFSSRGPRGGDYALKPDVTAPGDAIVAARATGTELDTVVDELHVAASGTSMSAPHVAGAAAVLKQARPELTGEDLKAILMGSAQSTSGSVWDEGTGRIHLPTALEQRVVASPSSLSFGAFEFPQEGSAKQTLTYENPTDVDVTFDLTVDATGPDGESLPADAVTLTTTSVTVPAQGAATVDVAAERATGGIGRYSGAVTATTAGGGEIRTAFGWYKEPEYQDLTVKALGRDGKPYDGEAQVGVLNVDDGTLFSEFVELVDGTWTGRVPAGTYSVAGKLWEQDAEGTVTELTAAWEPETEVASDTTVVLDASTAEPVTVTTERPAEQEQVYLGLDRTDEPHAWLTGLAATLPGGTDVYATPTGPVTTGGLDFSTGYALAAPTTGDETPAYTYDLLYPQDAVETLAFTATSENTAEVAVSYADLGPGADVQSRRSGEVADKWWIFRPGYAHPVTPGTTRTEYVSANDVIWANSADLEAGDGSGSVYIDGDARTYTPGDRAAETLGGAVLNTRFGEYRQFETQGDQLVLSLSGWTDAAGHSATGFPTAERLRVWQDGTEVADVEETFAYLPLPAEGADYRVALDVGRDAAWWNRSTRVSTEWTVRAEPGGSESEPVELPALDVAYDVKGMDLANEAPRRTTATVTVGHQAGSTGGKVARARLWWSADDGATWRKAALHRTGAGVYTAGVRAPAGTEHVSFRFSAKDRAGATVEQTVIRAYGVR